ncbi:hypothetical protein ACJX0J_018353, partial [Zea mays]
VQYINLNSIWKIFEDNWKGKLVLAMFMLKYRLAKWNILCQPKDIEGLGIQNIDMQNKCLLRKLMRVKDVFFGLGWLAFMDYFSWNLTLSGQFTKNVCFLIITCFLGNILA